MTDLRVALVQRLTGAQRSDFLATLLRVATANEVSLAERNRLKPVSEWIEASEDDLLQALKKADDDSLPLERLVSSLLDLEARFWLFREACAVAWVDGRRSAEEKEILDLLAAALGIDEESKEIMDSPLACSPEGERRFLELLSLTHEASSLEG